MQTIGLIGGISWESTAAYYEGINKGVQARLGGLHSAKIVVDSLDFAEITELEDKGEWGRVGALLAESARKLAAAGADAILICSATDHKVYDEVAAATDVPVINLADELAERAKAAGMRTVGFLSTKYTMTDHFFAERISSHGLDVNLPDEVHVDTLDDIIFDELVFRVINASSRKRLLTIVDELSDSGVDGVIFGASELSLLVRPDDVKLTTIDLITVGVEACLERALS